MRTSREVRRTGRDVNVLTLTSKGQTEEEAEKETEKECQENQKRIKSKAEGVPDGGSGQLSQGTGRDNAVTEVSNEQISGGTPGDSTAGQFPPQPHSNIPF